MHEPSARAGNPRCAHATLSQTHTDNLLQPMRRRDLTTLGLALACGQRLALAATYPSHPLRLLIGSAAGSSPDAIARLVAAGMSPRLGQAVIVENKPGASTAIGIGEVARSPPDGYLAGYATPALVLNPALHMPLPFDAERDLQPVIQFGSQPLVMVVRQTSPYLRIDQLIDAARRQPDMLSFASTGLGSIFHLTMERVSMATGARCLHVPYLSGPQAITDLIGGAVDCMFNAVNVVLPMLRSGRLRGLAITGRNRAPLLPDVPTIAERLVPDFDVQSWGGMVVRARTPRDVVSVLNAAANSALAQAHVVEALTQSGYEIVGGTSDAFKDFLRSESVRWGDAIAHSGITLR